MKRRTYRNAIDTRVIGELASTEATTSLFGKVVTWTSAWLGELTFG